MNNTKFPLRFPPKRKIKKKSKCCYFLFTFDVTFNLRMAFKKKMLVAKILLYVK